jgi:hypothetical protein
MALLQGRAAQKRMLRQTGVPTRLPLNHNASNNGRISSIQPVSVSQPRRQLPCQPINNPPRVEHDHTITTPGRHDKRSRKIAGPGPAPAPGPGRDPDPGPAGSTPPAPPPVPAHPPEDNCEELDGTGTGGVGTAAPQLGGAAAPGCSGCGIVAAVTSTWREAPDAAGSTRAASAPPETPPVSPAPAPAPPGPKYLSDNWS